MPPLTILLIVILSGLILFLPRKYAAIPLIIGACTIPLGSALDIASLSFTPPRILVFIAFVRIILKGEVREIDLNRIDINLLVFITVYVIVGLLYKRDDGRTIVFTLGRLYDTCGFYFSFRFWIRSKEDILNAVSFLSLVLMVVSLEMIYEKIKVFNLFSNLGGVRSVPLIRDGMVRAQGPFGHAILAGTVGATTIGYYYSLYMQRESRKVFAVIGFFSSIIMVITSASSGPFMSTLILMVGLGAWVFRENMSLIRWGILISLLVLEIAMESHIWYLMARIDLTGSSTGWHRAELINNALMHLNEWWLFGTDYTRHWMPSGVTWSPRHTDITNHYLSHGVQGGLFSMILFVFIIVNGFRMIGETIEEADNTPDQLMIWSFGAILFTYTITFLSVSCFDQSKLFFYINIALIASLPNFIDNNNMSEDNRQVLSDTDE